jgi:hypothetical protein
MNGHESLEHWDVYLTLSNDRDLYQMVRRLKTAEAIYKKLEGRSTPKGTPYTLDNIQGVLNNWEATWRQ